MPLLTVDALNCPIAFAPIPFRKGHVDLKAHATNVRYLIDNNSLDHGRRRVVALGGSSLIHHVSPGEQLELAEITGEVIGDRAFWMSAVLPAPLTDAISVVRRQMALKRAPDMFLLMPVAGVVNPEGVYTSLRGLTDLLAAQTGARFILYLRDPAFLSAYTRLSRESEHVIGVKIGTSLNEVGPARAELSEAKAVVWGIGDLSSDGIRAGARGHTSGTAIVCARLVDELNNAHRRGDFETAARLEAIVRPFEEIRFMTNRAWNYSAVIELMKIAGFEDVDAGDGGPFNAPPPPEITTQLDRIARDLRPWHQAAAMSTAG